jgi:hypothetical protein
LAQKATLEFVKVAFWAMIEACHTKLFWLWGVCTYTIAILFSAEESSLDGKVEEVMFGEHQTGTIQSIF